MSSHLGRSAGGRESSFQQATRQPSACEHVRTNAIHKAEEADLSAMQDRKLLPTAKEKLGTRYDLATHWGGSEIGY